MKDLTFLLLALAPFVGVVIGFVAMFLFEAWVR